MWLILRKEKETHPSCEETQLQPIIDCHWGSTYIHGPKKSKEAHSQPIRSKHTDRSATSGVKLHNLSAKHLKPTDTPTIVLEERRCKGSQPGVGRTLGLTKLKLALLASSRHVEAVTDLAIRLWEIPQTLLSRTNLQRTGNMREGAPLWDIHCPGIVLGPHKY